MDTPQPSFVVINSGNHCDSACNEHGPWQQVLKETHIVSYWGVEDGGYPLFIIGGKIKLFQVVL